MYDWAAKTDTQIEQFIVADHARLKDRRDVLKDLWLLLAKVFRPRRSDILRMGDPGQRYGSALYEDTGVRALNIYACGFTGYMVSRSSPWFRSVPPSSKLMDDDAVKEALEAIDEQGKSAVNKSNFYQANLQLTRDGGCFGTGAMIPDDDVAKDRVTFKPIHVGECLVHRDESGEVLVFHRDSYKLTAIKAYEFFGKDCPQSIADLALGTESQPASPFEEFEFIYAIYPNNSSRKGGADNMDLPWVEFYLCVSSSGSGSDMRGNRLIRKRGRRSQAIVWAPDLEQSWDYGTGLAYHALTQMLVCNKLGEKLLLAAHKGVEPPVAYSASLRGDLQLGPGGRNKLASPNDMIKAIQDTMDWPVTDAELKRRLASIEDHFFVSLFRMLTSRDLPANITAFQIRQMMGELSLIMGSLIDSYETQVLQPAVAAVVGYEFSVSGRLSVNDLPEQLIMMGGPHIDYIGPLAQIQTSMYRTQRLVDAISGIQQVASVFQPSLDVVDGDGLMEDVAVGLGVPQRRIRSEQEVMDRRIELAKWNQQNEMAQQLQAAGRAAPGLGKAIEPGSPLALASGEAA